MFLDTIFVLTSVFATPNIAAAVPAVAQAAVAETPSADAVVSKVQSFYESNAQLTAKFRQVYTNTTFGKRSVSDGKVWLKKAGSKMRWDYYQKARKGSSPTVKKSLLSDGETLWAAEHDNRQYFKQSLKDTVLPVAVTFLAGKGDLRSDFNATIDTSGSYGSGQDYVLKLVPKTPSAQYKTLWLVVSADNYRVMQSIVLESSGNTNHFRFFAPDFKKKVEDGWFTLSERALKKKGYRLVEGNNSN